MIETIVTFLKTYSAETSTVAALMAIGAGLWAFFYGPFRKDKKLDLTEETIDKIAAKKSNQGPQLTVTEFIRIRREMKAELEAEFATAHEDEKTQLSARIAELESQIVNPEQALEVARKRIAELEALLERSGNDIGGDRIAEAREALERGDYSIADDLFAEIEVRRELEVQEAARAAYGQGEIAEAEVRWADAAEHYARAARLNPEFSYLFSASKLAWRAGEYEKALRLGENLLSLTRAGNDQEQLGAALNDLAMSLYATGRYEEAEPLCREALEIARKALGSNHRNFGSALTNFAALLKATGRYEEAEPLSREALEIDRKALGVEHPNYAGGLNNLAGLLEATGCFEEAEPL